MADPLISYYMGPRRGVSPDLLLITFLADLYVLCKEKPVKIDLYVYSLMLKIAYYNKISQKLLTEEHISLITFVKITT